MRNLAMIITLILLSCVDVKRDEETQGGTPKMLSIRLATDSSELILETCIDSNETNNTASIKQKLIFKMNGVIIAQTTSPIFDERKTLTSEDSLTVLDNVIYEIGVLEGSNGSVYTVYGAGSCNACPELFAFYKHSGECIWLNYSNKNKFYKNFGDFSSVCRLYGIDSLKWQNKEYRYVTLEL